MRKLKEPFSDTKINDKTYKVWGHLFNNNISASVVIGVVFLNPNSNMTSGLFTIDSECVCVCGGLLDHRLPYAKPAKTPESFS